MEVGIANEQDVEETRYSRKGGNINQPKVVSGCSASVFTKPTIIFGRF